MSTRLLSLVVALAALAVPGPLPSPAAQPIVLHSGSFAQGGPIPKRYAAALCEGSNVAPSVWWSRVPPLTRSLALTVRDPPEARGGGRPVALDRLRPSGRLKRDRGVGGRQGAPGRGGDRHQRARLARLLGPVSAARRDAPLHVHGLCARRGVRAGPAQRPAARPAVRDQLPRPCNRDARRQTYSR